MELTDKLMVVCNMDHPHYGCTGKLTGKVISVLGKPMAEVKAENCKHLNDGFFVGQGDLQPVGAYRRKRGTR